MWNELLVAAALMLVLEGLLPTLNPKAFKKTMLEAAKMNDQQLRWSGIITMIIGAIAIYVLKN